MTRKTSARGVGLAGLFWRYLITTGLALAAVALALVSVVLLLTGNGVVLTASAGAQAASEAILRARQTGIFDPEALPGYVAWALFDESGEVLNPGTMDARQLDEARADRAGYSMRFGLFYSRYHNWERLSDGSLLALQYTYAMPYASVWAQKRLPDFQLSILFALVFLSLLVAAVNTGRYVRILRGDAACLTEATRTIADRRLDRPLDAHVRVRELAGTLLAMEELRQSLAASLEHEWGMEQQRRRAFAALAHDLKTPLTLVSGHAQLLEEEALTDGQRESVQAIARGAEQIQDYVAQIRELSEQMEAGSPAREQTDLTGLFLEIAEEAAALCAARHVAFEKRVAEGMAGCVERAMLRRAVINLVDNAARMTPAGGRVWLEAKAAEGMLTVNVGDTGPGFSKEALRRAGQVFYTGESSRTPDGHAGFGLFLCAQVAARHGGALNLRNGEEGALASMTLSLQ